MSDYPLTIRKAPVIYVCGPMAGLTWQGMDDWREEVRQRMPDCEIRSPTRGKDWIKDVKQLDGLAYDQQLFGSISAIIKRDHWDVHGSDLMLANFLDPSMMSVRDILAEHGKLQVAKDAGLTDELLALATEQASIGSMVEYGFAHAYHTPVIAVMRKNSIYRPVFPLGSSLEIVPPLNAGIFAARKLLNLPDLET